MSDIQLRDYQTQSIDGLREGFKNNHKRQILAASTGAGKSIIAMSMLESASKKGSKVMFLCDRRVLVDQFSRHLSRHEIPHGCIMSGSWRVKPDENIQVASIQTLERRDSWPVMDLLIVDEIHAVMRGSLERYIDENPQAKIVGLTATPFNDKLGKYFTNVTNVITMKELVDQGYLVPFKVFIAKEIDTAGVKVTAGEWQKDELETRGLQIVGDVVNEFITLSDKIFGTIKKTICFSSGVKHGEELAKQFKARGINFVQISYKDSEEYKREVLDEFAKPDSTIQGVISSDILTRGFDQTDVEHIILARPLRKSLSMHIQMIGRGARSHPGKEFCLIQCHSGNFLRFRDDWQELFDNGVDELKYTGDSKKRVEMTDRVKKQSKCPSCGGLWTSTTNICNECGHERQRSNTLINVAGELTELDATNRKLIISKQDFYSQLIYVAKIKGYKDGWIANNYKKKFMCWPKGLKKEMQTPTPETMSWIKSRQIAYANAKKK